MEVHSMNIFLFSSVFSVEIQDTWRTLWEDVRVDSLRVSAAKLNEKAIPLYV